MDNEIALSIAIPTYNRAKSLENLLQGLLPQAQKLGNKVEVCISDNASPDTTREVVMNFENEYPGLIRYRASEKNLGVDKNILLVMEMSRGEFIWTLGDDDTIAENAVAEVLELIRNNRTGVGLFILKTQTYFNDEKTGKKIILRNTIQNDKPDVYEIDKKEVIGLSNTISFISVLIFSQGIVSQVLRDDRLLIERAMGTAHAYMPLIVFMFLNNPALKIIAFNKYPMVFRELPRFKFFIEDKFMLHYQVQKKINRIILSHKNIGKYDPLIIARDKKLRKIFIKDMIVMKTFGAFNYFSYMGCLKLFFQKANLIDALLFSAVFTILFLIPAAFLVFSYKGLLIIKHKKAWKERWNLISLESSAAKTGFRRRTNLANDFSSQ